MFSALILCGGKATRIRPISLNKPKSLIKINYKPFIYYQLKFLEKNKIQKVIICLGHKGKMIEEYVCSQNFRMKIIFSYDGKLLLGTGGAIKKALNYLDENFFILYGDSYVRINLKNLQKYFLKFKKKGLMTIYKNQNKYDRSNVGKIKNKYFYDKNKKNKKLKYNFIDYGINLLNKKAFFYFKNKKKFDLSEVFYLLSKKESLVYKEVNKRFYEIGSFKGINELKNFFKKRYEKF